MSSDFFIMALVYVGLSAFLLGCFFCVLVVLYWNTKAAEDVQTSGNAPVSDDAKSTLVKLYQQEAKP